MQHLHDKTRLKGKIYTIKLDYKAKIKRHKLL